MSTQCARYTLVAVLGIALGASAAGLMDLREPETKPVVAQPSEAPSKAPSTAQATLEPPKNTPIPPRQIVQTRSQNLTFEQLQALGYVDGTYDPDSHLADVVLNDPKKTSPGYGFYSSRGQTGAQLIDLEGRVLHRGRTNQKGAWQHCELLPNGDVIAIVKERRLSRYDKDSNLIWSVRGRFHHDLSIRGDEIFALARVARMIEYIHPQSPTLVDVIQVRSLDGELKREISVLDAIHDSAYGFLLPEVAHRKRAKKGRQLDVLHTNHVEVFDGRLADRDPIYAEGNILISMRNINAIAILDGNSAQVIWIWGPTNLTFQHHPTLLDDGHILLFDNGMTQSRIIEIDPLSHRITWEYSPKSGFFSKTQGSSQRLANGNTLITDSNRGYVLEVTPKGETVWKFANPVVNRKKEREAIWRMTRVDPATLTFLD
jgi:hypothetical protein